MTESRPAYSSVGQTMKEGEEHFKVRMQLREERLREKELPPVLPEDQVPTGKVVNVKETHGKKVDGQRIVLNDDTADQPIPDTQEMFSVDISRHSHPALCSLYTSPAF
eukprot:CAMPEP_0113895582 /NCGR_PEP_ID=MMETSP0780_2-20120614/17451_1 /TAXON_ID=652834 /ORGANISM="Palpitomonas bilix" /LENGTH=107 /DNA_ID=CAMNT_0000886445 /DNA_START=112 /DNA_END=433 /DNA_ORIENTATION=+ /assembly_acc=CAM_ASM_000599